MTRFVIGATDDLPPGSYTNFEIAVETAINAPLDGIVALPFTSDWGPEETVVPLSNLGQYRAVYGQSTDTAGYRAVLQAFKGEAIENRGGAAQVLGYRMVGSSGAQAKAKLKDTTGEPKLEALVLTAIYKGAKGNDLGYKVIVNAKDSAMHDLILFDGTQEIERYTYVKAEIAKVAAAINARSNWVTADDSKKGVTALATVSSITPFTGGDSGTTLAAENWTNAMDELGKQRFGVFVPYDLTDGSIEASLKEWGQNLNDTKNKRFEVLVGGKLNETIDEAIERAESYNNENFATVGVGAYTDSDIIDSTTGDLVELSSSQLAPRIAGIIAACGEFEAITFSRLKGVTVVSGPTDDQIVAGLSGGVITIGIDSNIASPARIVRGITTYTDDTTDKPSKFYSVLKFVRIMQGFENDLQDLWTNGIIGKLPVDQETREEVVGKGTKLLKERVEARIIHDTLLDGEKAYFVKVSQNPAPKDGDDFIALDYGIAPERTLDKMLNRIVIS